MPLPIYTGEFEIKRISLAGYYALNVDWENGHQSIFAFRLLRPLCPCADCKSEDPKKLAETPRHKTPVEIKNEKVLAIRWEDGHQSYYPPEYLRKHCACAACRGEPGLMDLM